MKHKSSYSKPNFIIKNFRLLAFTLFNGLIFKSHALGQCSQCQPDNSCYQPQGAQCPPSGQAPPMIVGQPYSTDVTFYMPPDTTISGIGTVQIVNVKFQSIAGLPNGITWECNNAAAGCNYAPASGEKWACIRFCGTPVCVPGTYTATITIIGTASTPFGNQNQTSTLQYTFTVQAPSGSNSGFSYSAVQGCDSLTVQFGALLNLGPPNTTEWLWDFGNGQISTDQNPPPVFYSMPGSYVVTLGTKIFKYVLTAVTCTSNGNWWCGDIEEPQLFGACTQSPEFYFKLTHGPGFYQSPTAPSGTSASWGPLAVVLESFNIALSFWDEDTGSPFGSQDDDGGTFATQIAGAGTYNFTTTSPFGGGMTGTFTIAKVLDTLIVTTDTIHVFPSPVTPVLSVSPNDTVCEGQSVTLSVPSGNWVYTWYRNGNILAGATEPHIYVADSGWYAVRLTHPLTGCISSEAALYVGHWPGVYNATITYNGSVLSVVAPPAISYQWLYNGLPVFPNGTGPTYEPKYTGPYSCVFTNAYGCSDTSNVIVVTSLAGLDSYRENTLWVYPNPAQDFLGLNISEDLVGEKLVIRDASGCAVAERLLRSNYESLDLTGLPAGVYVLHVSGARSLHTRLIKL